MFTHTKLTTTTFYRCGAHFVPLLTQTKTWKQQNLTRTAHQKNKLKTQNTKNSHKINKPKRLKTTNTNEKTTEPIKCEQTKKKRNRKRLQIRSFSQQPIRSRNIKITSFT
jgi:hypothetical protein